MLAARGEAQPPAVGRHEVNFSTLEPCASHGEMMRRDPEFWTHPRDCPSISLGCVWDGKISILSRAAVEHPDYDLYAWVDVGMHASGTSGEIFRGHGQKPWPHPKKLAMLPLDKISISHSGVNCNKMWNKPFEFWHCAAATAFVVPRSILFTVEKLFYSKLEDPPRCIEHWQHHNKTYVERDETYFGGYGCLSEQMILSVIARENPELFNWVGHGWGKTDRRQPDHRRDELCREGAGPRGPLRLARVGRRGGRGFQDAPACIAWRRAPLCARRRSDRGRSKGQPLHHRHRPQIR
ncbi:unnamed protein product [Prorocentrum cordatum]|uniref:Hexosyltransferase n=1 Tax=Prorocentrum cordatum TaxID=2364126 RepID=A0ABN9W9L2_9DINO|nr:unnamed protein product [Polarella glacialis]